jgi:hypothetical protein
MTHPIPLDSKDVPSIAPLILSPSPPAPPAVFVLVAIFAVVGFACRCSLVGLYELNV